MGEEAEKAKQNESTGELEVQEASGNGRLCVVRCLAAEISATRCCCGSEGMKCRCQADNTDFA